MKDFKDGVKYYTTAQCTITVFFPENDVCCLHCPYFSRSSGHCQLDKNITPPRPDRLVDRMCPLEILEDKPNDRESS